MNELTAKQELFVQEYLLDLNASAAARRAGYSPKTAFRMGQENMQKPAIIEAIEKAKVERIEKIKFDTEWVLTRLVLEATADLADLYTAEGSLKPVHEWPEIWRQGLVAGMDVVQLGGDSEAVVTKIKLSDRTKRLEMIGKHVDVQAFKDRLEVDLNASLAERMAAGRKRLGA
ncbi:MAG: terminase small subunit [Gammaproteobacteria bacterium]|nr:terminase small subunit [Gammaproteobacteria bacterium]